MKYFRTSEPWLRGTLADVPAIPRAVLHSLELAQEDILRWCGSLTDEELNARPGNIAPVAFHVRHIARSIDRLLTYAEGRQLDAVQLVQLESELDACATHFALFEEFNNAIDQAAGRIRTIDPSHLEEPRKVGRKGLRTSLGSLLVHIAEHTQRHVGQAITTAKILLASRAKL